MARLPMVSERPTDSDLAGLFADIRNRGIEIPNLYRVIGNSPTMLQAWIQFAWTLRLAAKTPRSLRELMIMRGAQAAGVDYEWVHHWPMALEAGVSESKLCALSKWRESELFTSEERAALQLVDEVTAEGGASAKTLEQLSEMFSADAIIELTLTACFYVCVSRMIRSLDVDIEPDFADYAPSGRNVEK